MKRRELEVKWVVKETVENYRQGVVRCPSDVVPYLTPWGHETQETLVVLFLDCRMKIFGHKEISKGTATSCIIDPQSIFRAALMGGASAIILSHNHPSGDTTPSSEDIAATKRLISLGENLNLPVLDHVIIGLSQEGIVTFRSMKELGQP